MVGFYPIVSRIEKIHCVPDSLNRQPRNVGKEQNEKKAKQVTFGIGRDFHANSASGQGGESPD